MPHGVATLCRMGLQHCAAWGCSLRRIRVAACAAWGCSPVPHGVAALLDALRELEVLGPIGEVVASLCQQAYEVAGEGVAGHVEAGDGDGA